MNPHQEEQALGKVYDTELLKRLLPFVAPHWALVVFSLVLIPFRALLAVIPPVLIGAALNYLVEGTARVDVPWLEPLVEPRFGWSMLVWLFVVLFTLALFQIVLETARSLSMVILGQRTARDMRGRAV